MQFQEFETRVIPMAFLNFMIYRVSVVKLHHGDPIETGITAMERPLMTPIIPKVYYTFAAFS